MNLLKETLDALKENGKTPADVRWVCRTSISARCTWDEFAKQADFEYGTAMYGLYGWEYVPEDLVIIGDNWWLERDGYDDTDWWVFRAFPEELVQNGQAFSSDLGFRR